MPWASKWLRASVKLLARVFVEVADDLLGERRRGVDAGAHGCPTERQLAGAREHARQPLPGVRRRRSVPAELLAECDRSGVHQVRAARLHSIGILLGLARERVGERFDRLVERPGRQHRCDVDRTGERVVGGLAGVDDVVRVALLAGPHGERRDHLVDVHVGAGPRAGLEHVDRELAVVLSVDDLGGCCHDRVPLRDGDHVEVGVGACGGGLDPRERVDERLRKGPPADREVVYRTLGLGAPEGVGRHLELTHGVAFDAEIGAHAAEATRTTGLPVCGRRRASSARRGPAGGRDGRAPPRHRRPSSGRRRGPASARRTRPPAPLRR